MRRSGVDGAFGGGVDDGEDRVGTRWRDLQLIQ